MADPVKVFLDANVLAKPLTRTLLIIGGPLSGFATVWSERALVEADRHLGPGKTPVRHLVTRFGWDVGPTGEIAGRFSATDDSDRQLLADAEAADASFLVTEDVDDFDEADLVSVGISAANPDLFLSVRLTADAYREALETIGATRQRPPSAPEQIHAALGRNHPLLTARFDSLYPGVEVAERVQAEPQVVFRGAGVWPAAPCSPAPMTSNAAWDQSAATLPTDSRSPVALSAVVSVDPAFEPAVRRQLEDRLLGRCAGRDVPERIVEKSCQHRVVRVRPGRFRHLGGTWRGPVATCHILLPGVGLRGLPRVLFSHASSLPRAAAIEAGRGSSDRSEVESSSFVGGALGCSGAGVADEHVGAGPAGDGHEAGLGAAGGEPPMGGGVTQTMGSEVLDAGASGAAAQAAVEPVSAEPFGAVPEPQVGGVSQRVSFACREVLKERFDGMLPDRDHSPAVSFASADGDPSFEEVEVIELQVDEFAGSDGGLEHDPDDGLVTTMVQCVLGVGSV